jgi:hypothetical protein
LLLVVIGSCWQVVNLYNFTRVNVALRNRSLPFTESPADHFVNPKAPQTLSVLEREVNAGKRLILLYNYLSYSENTTDPDAIPERLYIRLGHKKFNDRVFIFSKIKQRYSQVPIREPKYFDEIIQNSKKEKSFKDIEIFKLTKEINPKSKDEVDLQMAALQKYFILKKCNEEVPDWDCLKVESIK